MAENYMDLMTLGRDMGQAKGGIPTPEQRIFSVDEQRRAKETQGWEEAIRQSARAREIRKAQNDSILPENDVVRDIAGGVVRGTGAVAEGVGYLSGAVVDNPISRGLEKSGEFLGNQGQEILDARSLQTQNQIESTQIDGNIFTGEDWTAGKAPSLSGLFHQVLPSIAEMAPQIASLIVGGAPGVVASVATGVAQAGISQGNQQWDAIMQKSEKEMMDFSTSYQQLRAQFPDMSHAEAKKQIADTGKMQAAVVGGAIGGAGGAATRWLWNGAPLAKLGTLGKGAAAGEEALKKAARTKTQTITSLPARIAAGAAEEGTEEVLESVGATVAVNRAIGSKQEVGKGSVGEFALGALAGAPINAAGIIKNDDLERQAEEAEEEAAELKNNVALGAETKKILDEGKASELVKPGSKHRPDVVASQLALQIKDKDTSPEKRKEAIEALATLGTQTNTQLAEQKEIKKQGVEAYYAPKLENAVKSIAMAEAALANPPEGVSKTTINGFLAKAKADKAALERTIEAQNQITDVERDNRIKDLDKTSAKVLAGSIAGKQAVRDQTPDDTAQLVQQTTNEEATPEVRTEATEQVIDRAISEPDKVSNQQLEMMFSNSSTTPAQKKIIKKTLEMRGLLDPDGKFTADLQTIKSKLRPEDKELGFVNVDQIYEKIDQALVAGDIPSANKQLDSLREFAKHKISKAKAAKEAREKAIANPGKQYKIVPVPGTDYQVYDIQEFTWLKGKLQQATDLLKKDHGLAFHKGSKRLSDNIQAEADFILGHGQLLAHQIERAGSQLPTPAATTPPVSSPPEAVQSGETTEDSSDQDEADAFAAALAEFDAITAPPTSTPPAKKASKPFKPAVTPEEAAASKGSVPAEKPAETKALVDTPKAERIAPPAKVKPLPETGKSQSKAANVPFVAPVVKGIADNPEADTQIQKAYKALGEMQAQRLDLSEGTPDKDAIHSERIKIKALAEKLYPGPEMERVRFLINQLNTASGAPYRNVAAWAWKEGTGEIKALLAELANTQSFKDVPSVTLLDGAQGTNQGYRTAGFDPNTNLISLAPALLDKESSNAMKERISEEIAHELLHPITNKVLESDQEFFDEVIAARKIARDWYESDDNFVAIQDLKNDGVSFDEFEYAIGEHKYDGDPDYPHEFLATLMASSRAKRILIQIPDTGKTDRNLLESLRDAFVAALKRFFPELTIDDTLLVRVTGLGSYAIQADVAVEENTDGGDITRTGSKADSDRDATVDSTGTGNSSNLGNANDSTIPNEADERAEQASIPAAREDQSIEILERQVVEDAIRTGRETLYGYETDGELTEHTGPITESVAKAGNLLRAMLPSRHRTVMSYSPEFVTDVLLNPAYKVDDLAIYLTDPEDAIAVWRKKGSPALYREVLKIHHDRWVEAFQKNVAQAKDPSYRAVNPIAYLIQDGELDSNAASAMAMTAFNYLANSGNTMWGNYTLSAQKGVMALGPDDTLPESMKKLALTIGKREGTVRTELGKEAARLMDITLPEGTPRNFLAAFHESMGTHILLQLQRDGIVQRNVYNGLEVRPEGVMLVEKLKEAQQYPANDTRFHPKAGKETKRALWAHLQTTVLTQQERKSFYKYAFQSHPFVRINRTAQADVPKIYEKLHNEGLYQGDDITQAQFDAQVDASKVLNVYEKDRAKQVYRAYTRRDRQGKYTNKELPPAILSNILTATQGSRAFIDNLLGKESSRKLPTSNKAKAGFQETTRTNTNIDIPKHHIRQLDRAARQGHTVNQDMLGESGILTRMMAVDDNFLPLIQGMLPVGATYHYDDEISHKAKDEQLIREAEAITELIEDVLGGDREGKFYKRYSVQSNDRVGESSQGWNAQASRMHRGLESYPKWRFAVDPRLDDSDKSVRAFKYAVAQSLGISVDKVSPAVALKKFAALRDTAEVIEAVGLINMMRNDPDYTWDATESQRFIDLVRQATGMDSGAGTQYMRGLMELAKYESGEPFESDISAEIDGRASGATITMLQLGMTGPEDERDIHMQLGGVIPMSSPYESAGEAVEETQTDIYKTVVTGALDFMAARDAEIWEEGQKNPRVKWKFENHKARRNLVRAVLGSLTNEDPKTGELTGITGAARDAVKEGTTANVFGAGNPMLENTMSADFYVRYKERLVEYADSGDVAAADFLIQSINFLTGTKHPNIELRADGDYTDTKIDAKMKLAISDAIKYTFARATAQSIDAEFTHSRRVSKKIMGTLNMVQKLYKTAYDAEKRLILNEQYVKAKKAGDPIFMPTIEHANQERSKTVYTPDLTPAQEQQIHKKLALMNPMIHSPSSLAENNASKGISPYRSGSRVASEDIDPLTGQEGGGTRFSSTSGQSFLSEPFTPATIRPESLSMKSPPTRAEQRNFMVESIKGLSGPMHAQDAMTAINTFVKHFAINAHDGFTAGGGMMEGMGQTANKAFLDTIAGYSAGEQVARMALQTVDAFGALRARYKDDPQFLLDMEGSLPTEKVQDAEGKWISVPVDESPTEYLHELLEMVDAATKAKYRALASTKAMDQYYYPGSAYVLSDAERKNYAALAESSSVMDTLIGQRSDLAEPMPSTEYSGGKAKKKWLDVNNAGYNPEALTEIKSFAGEAKIDAEIEAAIAESALIREDRARLAGALKKSRKPGYWAGKGQSIKLSQLKAINAELNRSGGASIGKMIGVVDRVVKSPDLRDLYLGELANPQSDLIYQLPENTAKELRDWHAEYHSMGRNKEMMYSPAATASSTFEYSSQRIFDALDQGKLSSDEAAHLKALLSNVANKLYDNEGGVSPGLTRSEMGESADELAARHTIENIGPFSSNIQQAGITLSRAQAFVAEQVEITMQESLASHTMPDTKMLQIYSQAKAAFNKDGSDFYDGDYSQATDIEKAQAKQAYDLVFSGKADRPGVKSDRFSRFVALGLVYPPLRAALNKLDAPVQKKIPNEKLGARLERYFNLLMSKIAARITGVGRRDPADEALGKLAKKLALNEHKRRIALNREKAKSIDFIDNAADAVSRKLQSGVASASTSKIFRNSKYAMVEAVGELSNLAANERMDAFIALLEKWKDDEKKGVRETMLRSIINEIRGENPENRRFYKLLSWAKVIEQTRKAKKDITQEEVLSRFADADKLTGDQKAAITQLYLRSDMAGLRELGYSMDKIHDMVRGGDALDSQISDVQDKLLAVEGGDSLIRDSAELGYFMATGRNVSEFGYLNARTLVRDSGLSNDKQKPIEPWMQSSEHQGEYQGADRMEWTGERDAAQALVDELASLQALSHSSFKHRTAIASVIDAESVRGDADALRYLVDLHNHTLKDGRENLFHADGLKAIKGYVRESYNPYDTMEVAGAARGAELVAMGYTLYGPVQNSAMATSHVDMKTVKGNTTGQIARAQIVDPKMYILKGVGMSDYQTASMLNNQQKARGNVDRTAFEFLAANEEFTYLNQSSTARLMVAKRQAAKQTRTSKLNAKTYRPNHGMKTHEMPVFDNSGSVTGYRYMADHQTRDEAMERDNRFEAVMGATVGSTYSKKEAIEQNTKVVKTLKEFYDEDYVGNENRYVEVSPTAADERMRETYNLLPDEAKRDINNAWGGNKMFVRKDLIDITLGYRALTLDKVINKSHERVNQMLSKQVVGALLGPKRAIQVRRFHDHIAHIMRVYKDFIVVKNATTLLNNMKSNAVLLFMYDVSVGNIISGHRRAFQGLKDYQSTEKKLLRLKTRINAADPQVNMLDEELEVKELQARLDRNPVKVLIDEGMFQTILDDVDLDRENTTYRTDSEKFTEKYVNKLPDFAARAGKEAFVSQDTWTYKMLSQTTQMSDFVARFVLYEHLKREAAKGSGLSEDDIMSEVRQSFVNYNRPTDQKLQFMNDLGLVRFTKYTLGTQKIIYERLKKKPSRAMVSYMADRHIDGLQTILGSSIPGNLGNPLEPSIIDAPTVLDEPVWIKMLLGFL